MKEKKSINGYAIGITILTMIMIFIIFQFPYYAASILHMRISKVMTLFSVQHSIKYTSAGLRILLSVLILSVSLAIIASGISSCTKYCFHDRDIKAFINSWISSILKIIGLFSIMLTMSELMYTQGWTSSVIEDIFNLLRIMNILSYGLVVLDSGF